MTKTLTDQKLERQSLTTRTEDSDQTHADVAGNARSSRIEVREVRVKPIEGIAKSLWPNL